jgi:hypothetical protein
MNRRNSLLFARLLCAVVLGAPLAVAAQAVAAEQAPPRSTASEDVVSAPGAAATDEARIAEEKKMRAEPYCLRHTGSLIRQTGSRQRCMAIGKAYTRDDLDRTGATDIGDALRRLDSSIR